MTVLPWVVIALLGLPFVAIIGVVLFEVLCEAWWLILGLALCVAVAVPLVWAMHQVGAW